MKLEKQIRHAFYVSQCLVAVFFELDKTYYNLAVMVFGILEPQRLSVIVFFLIENSDDGVPQGSVFSVTLFAIAVSELANNIACL